MTDIATDLMSADAEADLLAGVFAYPRLRLARGAGSWVWDTAGTRYLDFTAGLAVLALGHGRADLADTLRDQFMTLGHCSNLFGNTPVLELAQRLKSASFAKRIWFANSGSEANEAALKFARLWGRAHGGERKHEFIAFTHGFHGRTMGSLSVTHEPAYRAPFAPLIDGVRFVPFNDLAATDAAFDGNVCGVIVEPVQGEGGVLPATPEFLQGLRKLCDEHHAQLIFDEIQCGMGRTGTLFAYQQYNVVPDMMSLAKPLASGLPLGALLIGAPMADLLHPGQHGSTFAGGPTLCKVACGVFDAINTPAFLNEVQRLGARLHAGLQTLVGPETLFAQARGLGLMQALVLADVKKHAPGEVVSWVRDQGVLVTRAGHDAIRLVPPLNCTDAEIDLAVRALATVSREWST